LTGGGTWFETPDTGLDALPLTVLAVELGWRRALAAGSYFGLTAAGRLAGYWSESSTFTDAESFELIAGFPLARARLELGAGLSASAMGSGEEAAHLRPDWRATLRFGEGPFRGELQYRGAFLWEPDAVEDVFSQGVQVAAGVDPSVRLGLRGGLQGTWECWPDTFLYDATGTATGQRRQDVVGGLEVKLEGLAGYFLDWRAGASAGLRFSNANRYLPALGLEANSESSWYLSADAGLQWSPTRRLNVLLESFLRHDEFLDRSALTASGTDTGETLRVLSGGFSLRGDWTPDSRLFVVLEGSAARRLANDPLEERWNVTVEAGVEYSF
jgi:hypothetical protein